LSLAHERGLVHRDLKPENVFLHRDDREVVPKILDFGLVKAIDSARQSSSGESSAGLLIGTLDYMAPEQVMGGEVSPSWDIWALSVIAYEMLTGRHPFRHVVAHEPGTGRTTRPLLGRSADQCLSPALAQFFDGALSPDCVRRPGDAMSWLRAFERGIA
jgi:serine/threonine-protein kinase